MVASEAIKPIEETDGGHESSVAPLAETPSRGNPDAAPSSSNGSGAVPDSQQAVNHHGPRQRNQQIIYKDVDLIVGQHCFATNPQLRIGHKVKELA